MSRNFKIGVDKDANGRFEHGLITRLPVQEIPDGAASDSVNWLTKKGKIELCRGYTPLGDTLTGNGRISGMIVGEKASGTEIPFRSHGKKVKYYNSVTDAWVELGADILGTSADGEDVSFAKFQSSAGKQVWLNSPRSGPKKIMVANPGDYSDMYDSTKNYKTHLAIKQNRAFDWNIGNTDRNIVRMSYSEVRNLSDYTQIVAEVVGAAASPQTTFTGTLAFKAAGSKRSALDVTFTDGTETFSDNVDGTLTGSLGGTGTINYTTGAFSITFNTAPAAGNITATYRWVDETANGGIANFVVPGSRVSGEPNVFRQFTGGDIKTILSLKEHYFCAHEHAIYDLSISLDDTAATNLIFRENFGVPSLRGGTEAPEGIYTVDTNDPSDPKFILIGWYQNSIEITPKSISEDLDLSDYRFENLVVFAFNEFVLFCCRHKSGTQNDTTFVYNKTFNFWDRLDYAVSVLDIYDGSLIGGSSISNNVFTLFSGLDVEGANIYNFWQGGISKLRIKNLKKVKKLKLEGEIGPDQEIRVYASLDRGPFVEILDSAGGAFIKGSGGYVDRTQRVIVGALTIGTSEIGGGSDGVEAYHYERMLDFGQDRFSEVQIKFEAANIGYASITELEFHDIRVFQDKTARKYRE